MFSRSRFATKLLCAAAQHAATPTTPVSTATESISDVVKKANTSAIFPGMKVLGIVSSEAFGDPVHGQITAQIAGNVYTVMFEEVRNFPSVEIGSKVVVRREDGKRDAGLIARVHGNGYFAVLFDDDKFEKHVARDNLTVIDGRPRFLSNERYKELLNWICEAGVVKRNDAEVTACILYHRGWRAETMYLLEAPDVHCLHYLNKSVRMTVLEQAEWEKERTRALRDLQKEKVKEASWAYRMTKYSGVVSACIACFAAISVFTWNFKNYQRSTRAYQLAIAKQTLIDRFIVKNPPQQRVIARPETEASLRTVIDRLDVDHPRLVVISGPKGVGKSTVCARVLSNSSAPGIRVVIRPNDDPLRQIIKALKVSNIDACGDLLQFVSEACAQVKRETGKTPYLMLQLNEEKISRVYHEAVALACDQRVAHVLLEVDFKGLQGCEHLLRVDVYTIKAFTPEEAFEYVGRKIDPLALNDFIELAGTNASDLDELIAASVQRGLEPEKFLTQKLTQTMQLLRAMVKKDDDLKDILRVLSKAPFEEGFSIDRITNAHLEKLTMPNGTHNRVIYRNPEDDRWYFSSRLLYTCSRAVLL